MFPCRLVKFAFVNNLTVFIEDNQEGSEETKVGGGGAHTTIQHMFARGSQPRQHYYPWTATQDGTKPRNDRIGWIGCWVRPKGTESSLC